MSVSLVMTIIGGDRPGLVESLAFTVAAHDGNWLESRMSHLAGQFAGILRVDVEEDRSEALIAALKSQKDLSVVVASETGGTEKAPGNLIHLQLVGQDRPGIVRQISQALTTHGVNVEELHTECVSAAMSGEVLFQADAHLQVPAEFSLEDLRVELERVASDLMVDIVVERE